MTIQEAKEALVHWCESQIGYHEGPNNENKYADVAGIRQLYGWYPQNQPWCDVFVDAAFISVFGYDRASAMTYQLTGAGSAACSVSAAFYRTNGAWYSSPEVGDQIFFQSGGAISHTGVVTHVGIGALTTVEGNSSDSVVRRTYDLQDRSIAGYGRPRWELATVEQLPPPVQQPPAPAPRETAVFTVELPELRRGDRSAAVRIAQGLLEARRCTVGWYGIDGDFGSGTEQAVRNFQTAARIGVDGIVGPETWKALLEVD